MVERQARDPDNALAHYILGHSMQEEGQLDKAIVHYKKCLQLNPNFADAYYNLGTIFQDTKRNDEAISYYQQALRINPSDADVYYNLGLIFQEKDRLDEAMTCYQKSLHFSPHFADAYNNIGDIYTKKKRYDEAIFVFKKSLLINPAFAEAYNNLGRALAEKGEHDAAISCFQKSLEINPDFAEAYTNLGKELEGKDKPDEAIYCYQKALQSKPDLAEAYAALTFQMQRICNWKELGTMSVECDNLTRRALDAGIRPAEEPFMNISRHADPSINFEVARSWSRDIANAVSGYRTNFSFDDRGADRKKIVIGYLSNDFRNHPVAHLVMSLFGLHKRDEFKILCYSYGKDDGSRYRTRIRCDCDKFVDIADLSFDDAARSIYEYQVDILVDLTGYTRGGRLDICALRPAPVQVSYLGFPGTTGADFLDYIVADKIVAPEDHSRYYSEKFVYMPHCYQVNDHTQSISSRSWTKADFGLPKKCFVFCSFNQSYKIDAVMFDIWMRILRQVPEGILWLMVNGKITEDNLRREAGARGVPSERLIFAGRLPKDEHLARLKLADLALDTRIYNGHTTTSDALWAGVPIVALQGSHFASRVSSSILTAMGLPELIAYDSDGYERLAVSLAHNPAELQKIRERIAEDRVVAPLFDTPRFVRNLETAYKEMWKIYLSGEAPRQIEVFERQ
jgi:protein O-GlcNAc transferase